MSSPKRPMVFSDLGRLMASGPFLTTLVRGRWGGFGVGHQYYWVRAGGSRRFRHAVTLTPDVTLGVAISIYLVGSFS